MSELRLSTALWLERHGWATPVALLLLLVAATLHWGVEPALRAEARQHGGRVAQLEQQPSAEPQRHPEVAPDGLDAFHAVLAGHEQRDRLMLQLWQGAQAHTVHVSKVDFDEEADVAGGFVRLHLRLPLAGRYPDIKAFLFELMTAFPGLSLERLDLKRQQPGIATLEATLHLVLLMER